MSHEIESKESTLGQAARTTDDGRPASGVAETPLAEHTGVSGDERHEDAGHGKGRYLGDVIRERMERRSFLKGAAAAAGSGLFAQSLFGNKEAQAKGRGRDPGRRLRFEPIAPNSEDRIVVPDGYDHSVLVRWGDPLFPGAPQFDVNNQTGASQELQFGFNCDFIGFYPLPPWLRPLIASGFARLDQRFNDLSDWLDRPTTRALLVVNHEYTSGSEMFFGYTSASPTQDQVEVEWAAHGMSVVEIQRVGSGDWKYLQNSPFNRRITATTPIEISGPLRGHDLMKTTSDPDGVEVFGMLNNCAGGKTPWGTVLTCEENFDQYFANFRTTSADVARLSARIAAPGGATFRKWERYDSRFDLDEQNGEPNEYNRFGYVVEIDPYDPESKPKKRTAMGRFKHEGAVPAISRDGRVVVYSGDDARFEYIYKFVSRDKYQPGDREHNMQLLDHGTLYVARLYPDGTGEWVALPDDPESLLNTRGVADAAGATKMDRPEDIDVSPTTNKVYVALTNNTRRDEVADDPGEVAANPRLENEWGHVVEIDEEGGDNASLTFRWEIFILCGDPRQQDGLTDLADLQNDDGDNIPGIPDATYFAGFNPELVSPIAAPDNVVFDSDGNLWIATDGQPGKPFFGQNDGVFAVPTEGPDRGFLRQFLSGIPGGEVCGPEFSADNRTFFCGIQHPGEGAGLPNSLSTWPDRTDPPKPSVISVWNKRGQKIGAAGRPGNGRGNSTDDDE